MNDTDKVIIALGFFAVVGFLAYCVLTIHGGGSVVLSDQPQYVTVAELKAARENGGWRK